MFHAKLAAAACTGGRKLRTRRGGQENSGVAPRVVIGLHSWLACNRIARHLLVVIPCQEKEILAAAEALYKDQDNIERKGQSSELPPACHQNTRFMKDG